MSRNPLKSLRRGDSVDGIYLVENANFKQSRNGKPFIQMFLRDSSASVKALRWESNREEFRQIERNPFLHVGGRVEEYQGNMQIIVDELDALSAKDARVDPADFLPASRFPIEDMERELFTIIDGIPDDGIRKIVRTVLARPIVAEGLRKAPAGKSMHHAYVGGLLEHVLSLCNLAKSVLAHYRWLDPSILLAGVVLHDIGKVEELFYDTGFGYTDEGQLVGHIAMAMSWIDEAARQVPEANADRVRELKHVVASHHGKLEYGSPREPMTGEALAMHYLDNLDARLATYMESFDRVAQKEKGGFWADWNAMIGARLYFPAGFTARVEEDRNREREKPAAPAAKPTSEGEPRKEGELPF